MLLDPTRNYLIDLDHNLPDDIVRKLEIQLHKQIVHEHGYAYDKCLARGDVFMRVTFIPSATCPRWGYFYLNGNGVRREWNGPRSYVRLTVPDLLNL